MSFSPESERNSGFFTDEEQYMLGSATVAIAGAGGDGGMLAIQLARLGVGAQGGELRLADPDTFETENLNRQAACTTHTVGENKAIAVGRYIQDINPDIKVRAFTDGITPDNTREFVKGATLLIDETEFTIHAIGVGLARAARNEGIANLQVLNVGFGAQVTSYHPDSRYTFERRLGLREDMDLAEVSQKEVDVTRWLAHLPSKYADIEMFKKVATGEKSAPSVAPGVAIAAGMGATQAVLHILRDQNNRERPVTFPQTQVFDAMSFESHKVNFPRLRLTASYGKMWLRNFFGRNPSVSY